MHRSTAKSVALLKCSRQVVKTWESESNPEHQRFETVAHNSVFASRKGCRESGSKSLRKQHEPTEVTLLKQRGHSSVGRAVALQAIGLGFESPCLHQSGFKVWVLK